MTFEDFKDSAPARDTVHSLIGLDITPIKSWREYGDAVARSNRNAAFIARARKLGSKSSTGEYAVLLAVLFSMDYVWLAEEIEAARQTPFLRAASRTFGRHAQAVGAVMSMGA